MYIVQVLRTQPESPVCAARRVGEFETEEKARYFLSAAAHGEWPRNYDLVIRMEEAATCGLIADSAAAHVLGSPGRKPVGGDQTPRAVARLA